MKDKLKSYEDRHKEQELDGIGDVATKASNFKTKQTFPGVVVINPLTYSVDPIAGFVGLPNTIHNREKIRAQIYNSIKSDLNIANIKVTTDPNSSSDIILNIDYD